MHMAKNFLTIAAIVLLFNLINVAEAATPLSSPLNFNTIVVDASGEVPGLTQAQLTEFLVQKMQEVTPGPWHFVAAESGAEPHPNRMVWSFKILRTVWKGGLTWALRHRHIRNPISEPKPNYI